MKTKTPLAIKLGSLRRFSPVATCALLTTLGLLVWALALPLSAKGQQAVARPIKAKGAITIAGMPNPDGLTATIHNVGEGTSTLVGKFHNVGDGTMSLVTGQTLYLAGAMTAANGDTINWSGPSEDGAWIIAGGTGRFANATGSFVMTVISQSEVVFNPDGTFTFALVFTAEGEVVY